MNDTEIRHRFETILSNIRQPARLIGEEFGAGPGFRGGQDGLRVVLGFPDTYEIGISNQAIQVLYHVARMTEGVAVERTYLPWVDAIDEMRRNGVPLLTIETWSPVASADIVGITLQHEFDYTNVLEMLDLAGIPLHSSDRGEGQPLVIAGGPACADFLPMARFFDAVAVGDGEEAFAEILSALVVARSEGTSRAGLKDRLSRIDGVYVPGLNRTVERRIIASLRGAPYPDECLVPLVAGVHDRAWIEVMRGCTRGCRFCQAGMWYRPVRERSPEEVTRMAASQLASTGHAELALASLSTTDHSSIEQLLMAMAVEHPEVRVSLPSLRVDSAAVRMAHVASPTGPSLTLAPEAGSPRMWDIINKSITEDDVLAAAGEAFRTGRTTLKLYFIIGFPFEDDADVIAIAELCLRLRELGRTILGPRAGRLQLNVSVNNFIPKPFTPFQWAGMADGETLLRRQDLLRSRLRKPGIKLTLHGIDKSHLEAALARGDEEMGEVVERAWRAGARFDSWTEQFRRDAWHGAFGSVGTTAEALATSELSRDRPLPWDMISGTVDAGFLREEAEKAERGETTPDCRWNACSGCGVCGGDRANELALGMEGQVKHRVEEVMTRSGTREVVRRQPVGPASGDGRPARTLLPKVRHRYMATFSVTGRGRFVGHLDRVEILRRAIRRAGGRLALSGGMRPKPLLSLALPLAVGVEGLRELCEFELAEPAEPGFFTALSSTLPAHMRLLALEPYRAARSVPARVSAAQYEVQIEARQASGAGAPDQARGTELCAALAGAAGLFAEATELPIEEEREGATRRVDVRRYVDSVRVEPGPGEACTLTFRADVTPSGTARPERVVEALGVLAGVTLNADRITRSRVELA